VDDVEAEVEHLLHGCRAVDPALVAESRTLLHRPPLQTDRDEPIVGALCQAVESVRHRPAEAGGMSYWADSAFLSARSIPTVLFGPGGEGAHADVEWVSLADTADCARILTDTAVALFTKRA
jgi:acetylornithine deacetylase